MLTMDESGRTCSAFEAQKWRKRKCKHCFQDIEQHSQEKSDENNGLSKPDNHGRRASLRELCLSNADSQAEFEENLNREVCNCLLCNFCVMNGIQLHRAL